jgi:hypothetical protein
MMRLLAALVLLCLVPSCSPEIIEEPYAFTTLAGSPLFLAKDGVGTSARFGNFTSLCSDRDGNVYAVDHSGVRKVTPDGVVTTLTRGRFVDVAVNGSGEVFVVAYPLGLIFRVSELGGMIKRSDLPTGNRIVFDRSDNLYILTSDAVVKVAKDGSASTVASTGDIQLSLDLQSSIMDIAVDSKGDVYLASSKSPIIYKSTNVPNDGFFEEWVTLKPSELWPVPAPTALDTDTMGNVYVLDGGLHQVVEIAPDKTMHVAEFLFDRPYAPPLCRDCMDFVGPFTLAVDDNGNMFVGGLNTVLFRGKPPQAMSVFVGSPGGGPGNMDGLKDAAQFGRWISDPAAPSFLQPAGLESVAVDVSGTIYVSDPMNRRICKVTKEGEVSTLATGFGYSPFHDLTSVSLAVDPSTNIFVANYSTVSMITPDGLIQTLAGKSDEVGNVDGPGELARFGTRYGLNTLGLLSMTRDSLGNLYVFDAGNINLRKLTFTGTNWMVSTLTNLVDINGTRTSLSAIVALVADPAGNLFAAEENTILKLSLVGTTWRVTTVAGYSSERGHNDGPGDVARFDRPKGLAFDPMGNLFVSDVSRIRKITPDGYVTTIAGSQSVGSSDGIGTNANFSVPHGVAVDAWGTIYVADDDNFILRKGFRPPRIASSAAATGIENGKFHFSASGPPETATIIQTSTNLIQWVPVSTNTIGGVLDFSEPEAPLAEHRFYRTSFP